MNTLFFFAFAGTIAIVILGMTIRRLKNLLDFDDNSNETEVTKT